MNVNAKVEELKSALLNDPRVQSVKNFFSKYSKKPSNEEKKLSDSHGLKKEKESKKQKDKEERVYINKYHPVILVHGIARFDVITHKIKTKILQLPEENPLVESKPKILEFFKPTSKVFDESALFDESSTTPTGAQESSPNIVENLIKPGNTSTSTSTSTSVNQESTYDSISTGDEEISEPNSEKSERLEESEVFGLEANQKQMKTEAEGPNEHNEQDNDSSDDDEIFYESPENSLNSASSGNDSSSSSNSDNPTKTMKKNKKKLSPRKKVYNFIQKFSDKVNKKLNSYLDKLHYFKGITTNFEKNQIATYTTATQFAASIKKRSNKLAKKIDKILAIHKKRFNIPDEDDNKIKCILICHSMGGLDSRYLATKLGYENKIYSITTIGTPHYGSSFASDLLTGKHKEIGLKISEILKNFCDIEGYFNLTAEFLQEFNEEIEDLEVNNNIRYQAFSAFQKREKISTFMVPSHDVIFKYDGPNDGLVSLKSQRWKPVLKTKDGTNQKIVERFDFPFPADHLNEVGWFNIEYLFGKDFSLINLMKYFSIQKEYENNVRKLYLCIAENLLKDALKDPNFQPKVDPKEFLIPTKNEAALENNPKKFENILEKAEEKFEKNGNQNMDRIPENNEEKASVVL